MDLLGQQEVLRNEALLLLTRLASGSPDLQKIAVFEGAFDRLFGIIRWVGGCRAGGMARAVSDGAFGCRHTERVPHTAPLRAS